MNKKVREALGRLREGLAELYSGRLKGVYLFGSHSRGDAREESDVDVLIVLDEVRDYRKEIENTSKLVGDLSLEYDLSISDGHDKSPGPSKIQKKSQPSPSLKFCEAPAGTRPDRRSGLVTSGGQFRRSHRIPSLTRLLSRLSISRVFVSEKRWREDMSMFFMNVREEAVRV